MKNGRKLALMLFCLACSCSAVSQNLPNQPNFSNDQDLWLNSSDFGLSGPLSITMDYSHLLGVSLQAKYHTMITPFNAAAFEVDGGQNQFRFSGTFAQALTKQQRIKLTAEYLSQRLNFNFDDGSAKYWVSQPAFGLSYQYLLNNNWFHAINLNSYYAQAESRNLTSRYYSMSGSTYENYRRIAGGEDRGSSAGVELYPTHKTQVTAGMGYDRVSFNRKNEASENKTTISHYFSVAQILTPHLKVAANEKDSAIAHQFGGGIYWLLNSAPGTRFELGLSDQYTMAQPDMPNDNELMLNANYEWGGSPLTDRTYYADYDNSSENSSLLSYSETPAVRMPFVLAKRDQRSPVRITTIYISQIPNWAEDTKVGSVYYLDLKTLVQAPIDGGPLRIDLVGDLPNGLTYDPTTHVISGTVAAAALKSSNTSNALTIEACNDYTCAIPRHFSIRINIGNKPIISDIPANKQLVSENTPYKLDLKQYVPAPIVGGIMHIWITGDLPQGLEFDETSSIISGTPTLITSNPGPEITIHAQNGTGTATPKTFHITVVDGKPVISDIPPKAGKAFLSQPYSLNLKSYVESPPDAGAVSLSLDGALPAGLTFDASTGVISGTPGVKTDSPAALTLHAQNKNGEAIPKSFEIFVENGQPIIAPIPDSAQLTFLHHPYQLDLTQYVQAPLDGGPIVLTLDGADQLPAGLSYDATTHIISGTPTAVTAPPLQLTLHARNNIAAATPEIFHLNVEDGKPVISPIPTEKQHAFLGVPYSLDLKSYVQAIVDGGKVVITVSGDLPHGLTFNSDNETITGTPIATNPDNPPTLTINAHNDVDQADPVSFTLTVTDEKPVISDIPTDKEHAFLHHAFTLDLKPYVQSPADANPVVLSVDGTLPPGLTFDANTGIIQGTPTGTNNQPYNLTLNAHNIYESADPKPFHLTVEDAVPQIDSIPSSALTATQGKPYSLDLKQYVQSPLDAGTLVIGVNGSLPPGLTFDNQGDHPSYVISGTPTSVNTSGTSFEITAHNDLDSATPKSATIKVQPNIAFLECPSGTEISNNTSAGNISIDQPDTNGTLHHFSGTGIANASKQHYLVFVKIIAATNQYQCVYKLASSPTEQFNNDFKSTVSTPLPQNTAWEPPISNDKACGRDDTTGYNVSTVPPSDCRIKFDATTGKMRFIF